MTENKGGMALLLGGILMIVATFLTFVTLKGGGSEQTFSAKDAEEAAPYYMAAGIAIIAAIVMFVAKSDMPKKILAVIAILGVGFLGVYAAFVDITKAEDIAPAGSGFEASSGIGAYLALVGAVIAFVGAILSLKGDTTTTTTTPTTPAAPPPSTTPPPA